MALEALRDALKSRKTTADELWKCAKLNRVSNVMRPYLVAGGVRFDAENLRVAFSGLSQP